MDDSHFCHIILIFFQKFCLKTHKMDAEKSSIVGLPSVAHHSQGWPRLEPAAEGSSHVPNRGAKGPVPVICCHPEPASGGSRTRTQALWVENELDRPHTLILSCFFCVLGGADTQPSIKFQGWRHSLNVISNWWTMGSFIRQLVVQVWESSKRNAM